MRRFGRWLGWNVAFEQDPAAAGAANNPGATGGAGDPAKAAGGGGQPAPAKETYTIKVGGTERALTIEEMKDLAQKSAGADEKFREASEMRRNNEDAIRQSELIQRLSDPSHKPTDAEISELSLKLGVDPAEFAEYIGHNGSNDPKPPQNKGGGFDPNSIDEAAAQAIVQKALGISSAEARGIIEYSHQRHIEDAREKIRKFSDEMVDKDTIFGTMKVGEKKADRDAVIKEMVAEDVLGRIKDGGPFGAELVTASIQKVRTYLQKFGIPGRPDQQPLTMGLGPSSGLPAEVLSEKPIERKSAAEDGDEGNFLGRWMQRYLQSKRQQG
jgi:hypothetical protein